MVTGGQLERMRTPDVRHGEVAQCQRRAGKIEERLRSVDRRFHIQVCNRDHCPGTDEVQEEIEGKLSVNRYIDSAVRRDVSEIAVAMTVSSSGAI